MAAPTGQERCVLWGHQAPLAARSDWPGSQFPFGEGERCSQPFPSHPVIPADWLGTVGAGRMPAGAFLQVDKTRCVVVWCGVTHCVGLCMFLYREQDLQRSRPRLLQHAWTHTHTCVPSVLTSVVAVDVPSLSFCSRWQISVLAIYIRGCSFAAFYFCL